MLLLTIGLTSCTTYHSIQTPPPATEATSNPDLVHLLRTYDLAWLARDTGAMASFLAPDYAYYTDYGRVLLQDSILVDRVSPALTVQGFRRTEIVVRRHRGTAVISSRWQTEGSRNGQPFKIDQRCSTVMASGPAGWRILADHCSPIRVPG